MNWLLILLSFLPFVLLLFLIVWRRWPALYAMPLVWIITAISLFYIWELNIIWISASFIKGTLLSLEIMLIIFGAVWLIEILKVKGQIKYFQSLLSFISDDARVQVLIIAWLFGSLIEGVAGFGTPAALTAPLLVSLGFTPFLSVVLALIANSTAVSFGAAGTPVLLGLGGLGLERNFLEQLSTNIALIHLIASIIIPLALVYFIVSFKSEKNKFNDLSPAIPFALFAWLAFTVPYFLTAKYIGPELPSIIGGITGLIIVSLAAHFKFLTPKKIISFSKHKKHKYPLKQISLALLPYFLIVILLTLSRTIPTITKYISNISLSLNSILGVNLSYKFLPLFTPSFYLILTGIICIFIFKADKKEVSSTLKQTFSRVKYPTLALIFAVALVQLLLVSGNGNSNLQSMPLILAGFFADTFKNYFVLASPFVGMFGSFLAGSNTVSNLLFGTFQLETAKNLGMSVIIILSLQVVGGAVGNMIAIHNVLAAEATVNLRGAEGKIIRKTIGVAILYALIAGIVGWILTNVI